MGVGKLGKNLQRQFSSETVKAAKLHGPALHFSVRGIAVTKPVSTTHMRQRCSYCSCCQCYYRQCCYYLSSSLVISFVAFMREEMEEFRKREEKDKGEKKGRQNKKKREEGKEGEERKRGRKDEEGRKHQNRNRTWTDKVRREERITQKWKTEKGMTQ